MKRLCVAILTLGIVSCGSPSSELEAPSSEADVKTEIEVSATAIAMPALTGEHVWKVDKSKSRVGFEALEQGTSFPGQFDRFDLAIKLDPDNPENGRIEAIIDLSSVDAGSKERNQVLPTKDWFDVKNYAQAYFSSSNIVRLDSGDYEAKGDLSLKGISKEIVLPFTLDHDDVKAHATGKVGFNRTDFNVGDGSYKSEEYIDHNVVVFVDIYAER